MRQLKISQQITNRNTASLDKYLQDISKLEMVTAEEEVELAKKIREGDQNALDRLTKANLRFVVSVSKQYQNQGLTLPDLINEGNLGLIKAAQRFDETRGFKFISYAVWWIRQSILQALADQARIVRLPLNKIGALSKINKTFSKLEQKFERTPSADEIADELDLNPIDIQNSLASSGRHISMDAPLQNEDDSGSMYTVMSDPDADEPDSEMLLNSLRIEIDRSLKSLSGREVDVIKLFFGIGVKHALSLEEIGEKFGLTRERVRQIKEKAIKRLKNNSKTQILKSYLG